MYMIVLVLLNNMVVLFLFFFLRKHIVFHRAVPIFIATLLIIDKIWKKLECQLTGGWRRNIYNICLHTYTVYTL